MAKTTDYKAKYLALKRGMKKFLSANSELNNFMHEHLMELADEQCEEYDALVDKVDIAKEELGCI